MKKMIIIGAAALCATVAVGAEDGITSQVVGYSVSSFANKRYNAVGPCFVNTGNADAKFNMNDIVPTGFAWDNDKLYILNPATCGMLVELVWLDENMAKILNPNYKAGWYDPDKDYAPFTQMLDFGTGFRTYFFTKKIDLTYAGQVFGESVTIGNKRENGSDRYMIIPNVCPRTIKVNEIIAEGFAWDDDKLYILNPDTCGMAVELVWLNEDMAKKLNPDYKAGWYDPDQDYAPYTGTIDPGMGFRSYFFSKDVKITFPKAL